ALPAYLSTLSLHDALPILLRPETKAIVDQQFLTMKCANRAQPARIDGIALVVTDGVLERVEPARNQWIDHRYGITGFGERGRPRSEEHTSELQSLAYLVCR